jgi:hypothetical protein
MWYRWYRDVIGSFYLGGINEICDVFISKNFHFPLVIWQFFSSNFKLKFSFQISKNENFQFFASKFCGIFQFFHLPLVVRPKFSNSIQNCFFSIFSISLWWDGQIFFKIRKQNFQFKFQKRFFKNLSIPKFSCGINDFFLGPRSPNLLKDCKNYLFTLKKSLHTKNPFWDVH